MLAVIYVMPYGVVQVCTYVKYHQAILLRFMHFTMFELYIRNKNTINGLMLSKSIHPYLFLILSKVKPSLIQAIKML